MFSIYELTVAVTRAAPMVTPHLQEEKGQKIRSAELKLSKLTLASD